MKRYKVIGDHKVLLETKSIDKAMECYGNNYKTFNNLEVFDNKENKKLYWKAKEK